MSMNKIKLPRAIEVKVIRERGGVLFAELPEYSIFTEADTFSDLVFNVNDLVQSFFDVPEKLRANVWYSPPEELITRFLKIGSKAPAIYKNKENEIKIDPVLFSVLTSSSSNNNFMFK
ncbi:MAG: hypothetical protein NTX52_00300 [Planctomycetota bacterium]|nr:hypothetical protein [Planctomycetota bacterium]